MYTMASLLLISVYLLSIGIVSLIKWPESVVIMYQEQLVV